jgi:hypothetical protein
MQTEPTDGAASKRKRRCFQFSLRSLLIGVALLAVTCGYVGRQAEIVRKRQAMLDRIDGLGGVYWTAESFRELIQINFWTGVKQSDGWSPPRIPLIRSWLGDQAIVWIALPTLEQRREFGVAFPEASIGPFPNL